jgi:type II secretory pathway pseudopilin PulG
MKRVRGFTLVEMVIIIILLAGGATAMMALYSQASGAMTRSETIQVAVQLAQECSDYIVTRRRQQDYATVTGLGTTVCDSPNLPVYAGYNRTVATAAVAPGSGACPSTAGACTQYTVSTDAGGPVLAQTVFVLVN